MARKPEHQWETRLHRAFRQECVPAPWDQDPRAEAFSLRFLDGRQGWAILGLKRQVLGRQVARHDPEVLHAVRCWLVARGQRSISLHDEDGLALAGGAIHAADLGDPPRPPAERVITLAPSNAEIVAGLDSFERVIACEDSSDHPPEVADVERLGPDLGPDLERIRMLAPDLVVSSLSVPGMERVVTGLRAQGIRQVVAAPRSLDEVMGDIVRIAGYLGKRSRATELVAGLNKQRATLQSMRPSRPVRVYLEWWPRPMYTPGADCYSNELIALAGGINVFADRPGSSVEITAAELRAADPEICFVSWCGVPPNKLDPAHLRTRAELQGMEAVARGRVYALDERFSGRPGPRMLEASRLMAASIRTSGLLDRKRG